MTGRAFMPDETQSVTAAASPPAAPENAPSAVQEELLHNSTPPLPPMRRRRLTGRMVPLIPMLLALIAALVARHYGANFWDSADPMTGMKTHPTVDVGVTAPDFTLRDAHGGRITLSQVLDNQPVLLIYYLGYSCPRCVSNLQEIASHKAEFDKLGAQIIAISPDSVAETRDSLERYADFPFPMLSDPDLKVARAYGLEYRDAGAGMLMHGAVVIDTHRKVQFVMQSSQAYDNLSTIQAVLRSLGTH